MANLLTKKISDELGPLLKRKSKDAAEDVLDVTPPRSQGPKPQSTFGSRVLPDEDLSNVNKSLNKAGLAGTGIVAGAGALNSELDFQSEASGSWAEEAPEPATKDALMAAEPIAREIDSGLSSAVKSTDWTMPSLKLKDTSAFDAATAEANAAELAAESVQKQTAKAMGEYTKSVQDIQKLYRVERDSIKKQEIWEGLIQAAGLSAAGVYGLKSGVDMSGVKFQPSNWQAKLAESREHMQAMLDQAEKEMGAEYKNMELTERMKDKLLDNAYKAWQAENSTIENINRNRQAEFDAQRQAEILGLSREQMQLSNELARENLKALKSKQAEIAASGISPEKKKQMESDQAEVQKAMKGLMDAAKSEDEEIRMTSLKTYKSVFDKVANKYGMEPLKIEGEKGFWRSILGREGAPIAADVAAEKGGELIQAIPESTRSRSTGTQRTNVPEVGFESGGYRFKGGNPADPRSWEKIQ